VPSLKVTVPVGVKPVQAMVAVKVTGCPAADGLAEEVRETVGEPAWEVRPVRLKLVWAPPLGGVRAASLRKRRRRRPGRMHRAGRYR
jgi:metal-sulfur cluster biosynthetic enzyme